MTTKFPLLKNEFNLLKSILIQKEHISIPNHAYLNIIQNNILFSLYPDSLYIHGKNTFLASQYIKNILNKKNYISPQNNHITFNNYTIIGSDEVGTGTLYGPITVCAARITPQDIPKLQELGVTDSKRLSWNRIETLAPYLMKNYSYSSLTMSNTLYNQLMQKYKNMNVLKTLLHNRCMYSLCSRTSYEYIVLDKYSREDKYYSYLKGVKHQVKNINMLEHSESQVYAVAVASIIATYIYNQKMNKIKKKYPNLFQYSLHYVITHFPPKELNTIIKGNFKQVEDILYGNGKKVATRRFSSRCN